MQISHWESNDYICPNLIFGLQRPNSLTLSLKSLSSMALGCLSYNGISWSAKLTPHEIDRMAFYQNVSSMQPIKAYQIIGYGNDQAVTYIEYIQFLEILWTTHLHLYLTFALYVCWNIHLSPYIWYYVAYPFNVTVFYHVHSVSVPWTPLSYFVFISFLHFCQCSL